jgi:hypothetical protein
MVDPDWGELIRSELDSYVPRRLPARFVPGARRQHRVPMVDWRPVAVTIGVLLLGLGFATVAGGPEHVFREVLMSPSRNVTPTPTISPTPSPEQTTRPATPPTRPNPSRTVGRPTPAGSLQTPAPDSAGSTPTPPQTGAAPASAASPLPSPSNGVCLPVLGCLGS